MFSLRDKRLFEMSEVEIIRFSFGLVLLDDGIRFVYFGSLTTVQYCLTRGRDSTDIYIIVQISQGIESSVF